MRELKEWFGKELAHRQKVGHCFRLLAYRKKLRYEKETIKQELQSKKAELDENDKRLRKIVGVVANLTLN